MAFCVCEVFNFCQGHTHTLNNRTGWHKVNSKNTPIKFDLNGKILLVRSTYAFIHKRKESLVWIWCERELHKLMFMLLSLMLLQQLQLWTVEWLGMEVSMQRKTMEEVTKEAQENGSDPLVWAIQIYSNLNSVGESIPSTQLTEFLVSYICWDNNLPILWKFLDKALMLNFVTPMLLLSLLSLRFSISFLIICNKF